MKTDSTSDTQVGSTEPTEDEANSTTAVGMPPVGTPNKDHISTAEDLEKKFRRMFAEARGEPQWASAEEKAKHKAIVEGHGRPDGDSPPEPTKTPNPFGFYPVEEQETVYVGIVYGRDVDRDIITLLWFVADKNRDNVKEVCERRAEIESPRGCGDYWAEYHLWGVPESLAYWIIDILERKAECGSVIQTPNSAPCSVATRFLETAPTKISDPNGSGESQQGDGSELNQR